MVKWWLMTAKVPVAGAKMSQVSEVCRRRLICAFGVYEVTEYALGESKVFKVSH
jgi:hypothetical protein